MNEFPPGSPTASGSAYPPPPDSGLPYPPSSGGSGYGPTPNPYGPPSPDPNSPYGAYNPDPNSPYGTYNPDPNSPYGTYNPDPNGPYGAYGPNPNGPYGPGSYPPQPYPPYEARPRSTNSFAVVSLVFGILGGLLFSVIFGIVALAQIRKRGDKGRGLAIAGLILSGVWVLVIVAAIAITSLSSAKRDGSGAITESGSLSVMDLRIGDCLNGVADGKVSYTISAKSCSEPHDAEVITKFDLSIGAWPGRDAVSDKATSGCEKRLARMLSDSPMVDRLSGFILYPPDAASWRKDRSVKCLVVDANGGKLTEKVKR
ncbi:DUF4190 domain-containing protein [Microtetraspora sp. NBRC 16547]|uniref:DUF4190 domain-containing protein n=1 Tax=Microtetraspora sp. NBRC 16547 TaxID=3030993 RepID=UPI0024A4A42D|nr:DUF4190 domain-containing protein [Microtetraspora sp. NBRC 16547]GLW97453.1 hypothetical protein Misp02_15400 [Microtetraspora sp. NBRC 16547]